MDAGMVPMMQTIVMILLSGGAGIPLGVPPRAPDPVMVKIAPEQCLYFTTSMGMAEPDPASQNQVEQLLAEPEVQAFAAEVDRALKSFAAQAQRQGAPESRRC